jgi:hypothetical protein
LLPYIRLFYPIIYGYSTKKGTGFAKPVHEGSNQGSAEEAAGLGVGAFNHGRDGIHGRSRWGGGMFRRVKKG